MKKLTTSATPPLTIDEYTRIYNVIHSVALYVGADVARSCVMFGIAGASLMHSHYKKRADFVCGVGAIYLDRERECMLSWLPEHQAKPADALHAWVQSDGWIIDFTAPNYRETLAAATTESLESPVCLPRKMLQKRASDCQVPLALLTRPGRSQFFPNCDKTRQVIEEAFDAKLTSDFIDICKEWHRPYPGQIARSIVISDKHGGVNDVNLQQRTLVGAW